MDELTDDINQIEQYTEKLARNHTAILSSFQNERMLPKRSKNYNVDILLSEYNTLLTENIELVHEKLNYFLLYTFCVV